MKESRTKKSTKQIICIIIILMLCNFILPKIAYAETDVDGGGSIFDPFIKFTTFLCDSLMQFMQNTFTSNQSIKNGDGTYNFQYSPAIIFSGTVQGLDINFIKPNTDKRNTNNYEAFFREKEKDYFKETINDGNSNVTEVEFSNYFENAKKHEGARQFTESHTNSEYSSSTAIIYYEEIRGEETFLCVEYFIKNRWLNSVDYSRKLYLHI